MKKTKPTKEIVVAHLERMKSDPVYRDGFSGRLKHCPYKLDRALSARSMELVFDEPNTKENREAMDKVNKEIRKTEFGRWGDVETTMAEKW
jgi:hypothetical protein